MKFSIQNILEETIRLNASDLHLACNNKPLLRIHGILKPIDSAPVLTEKLISDAIYELVQEREFKEFYKTGELDTAISLDGGFRMRINCYRQQDSSAVALRLLPNQFFTFDKLGLPINVLDDICHMHAGLVLVTGATSSGKSTTIASIINEINKTRPCHIHTIEDPVEYKHQSLTAYVTQREVGRDTATFAEALKRAMREDPDVVVIGEMRDLETMSAALTLAETGHLTFATLHTSSAIQTISRIISSYPASQQAQVRIQLSSTLQYAICQQLIPWDDHSGRSMAAEVLAITPAVRAMIREEKTHQIRTAMQTNYGLGMRTMNQSLIKIVDDKKISIETALQYSQDKKELFNDLSGC